MFVQSHFSFSFCFLFIGLECNFDDLTFINIMIPYELNCIISELQMLHVARDKHQVPNFRPQKLITVNSVQFPYSIVINPLLTPSSVLVWGSNALCSRRPFICAAIGCEANYFQHPSSSTVLIDLQLEPPMKPLLLKVCCL